VFVLLILVYNIAGALGLTLFVDSAVPIPSIAYHGDESSNSVVGLYPNLVIGETMGVGATESWLVTAYFDVDPTEDLTNAHVECVPRWPNRASTAW